MQGRAQLEVVDEALDLLTPTGNARPLRKSERENGRWPTIFAANWMILLLVQPCDKRDGGELLRTVAITRDILDKIAVFLGTSDVRQ